jgi:glutamate/aspartate transport system permease protein
MKDLGVLLLAMAQYNAGMTLAAIGAALPIACLVAAARLSGPVWIGVPATAYVNILRSSPLVMIMLWVYTVGPMLTGRPSSAYASALFALAAFEVAYFTEIIRSGIQSIGAGQMAAALATGLSRNQAMRLVILPQALRRMTPALLTQSLIALQDSTIASVISVPDILQTTTVINAREQDPIVLYSMLAAIYFVVCWALSHAVRRMERGGQRRMGTLLAA